MCVYNPSYLALNDVPQDLDVLTRGGYSEAVPPYMRGDITPPESKVPILSFLDVFSNDFLRQDFRGFLVHLGKLLGSKFAFFCDIFPYHFLASFLNRFFGDLLSMLYPSRP